MRNKCDKNFIYKWKKTVDHTSKVYIPSSSLLLLWSQIQTILLLSCNRLYSRMDPESVSYVTRDWCQEGHIDCTWMHTGASFRTTAATATKALLQKGTFEVTSTSTQASRTTSARSASKSSATRLTWRHTRDLFMACPTEFTSVPQTILITTLPCTPQITR